MGYEVSFNSKNLYSFPIDSQSKINSQTNEIQPLNDQTPTMYSTSNKIYSLLRVQIPVESNPSPSIQTERFKPKLNSKAKDDQNSPVSTSFQVDPNLNINSKQKIKYFNFRHSNDPRYLDSVKDDLQKQRETFDIPLEVEVSSLENLIGKEQMVLLHEIASDYWRIYGQSDLANFDSSQTIGERQANYCFHQEIGRNQDCNETVKNLIIEYFTNVFTEWCEQQRKGIS